MLTKKALLRGPGRSKYKAVKVSVDGFTFHSKKEAARYHELKLAQKAGRIQGLTLQVPYLLTAGRDCLAVGHYIADFVYEERQGNHWERVVEDVKGLRTAFYKWKAKHMRAEHGISIRET